ncbi:high-affinity methionine permease [Xylaria curta]|nr:high-affinity methionine permease [Xylaria curta]
MGFPKFWGRPTAAASADPDSSSDLEVIHDGDLTYTVAKAHNGSGVTWQEATGAPVESKSPLGYHVGWATVIFLNVNQMIGTGIFSTPGTILGRTGSIGLALIYWVIGIFLAIAGFAVYLELASYFPNRSGSEVVYLEQAYPRPRHFFPISFAFYSVVLSFSSSNAIVLSNYLWALAHKTPTDWEVKGIAIAAYSVAVICVIAHNKYSLWAMNVIGIVKILTLIFISITGFVILGGHASRVADPGANFRNAFEGTTNNGNDLSMALVNIVFAYSGYANAFSVVNEIQNPIPTIKRNGAASIAVVATLYLLCNIAYFSAVPKAEFARSKATAASDFFAAVFGEGRAQDALNALVLISAFGNLLAVLIVVSLKTYPDGIFFVAMAIGLWIIRYRHKRLNRERPAFKAWDICLVFFLLVQIYTIATPWIPPKGGPYAGEVSFWYATYAVVGIGAIVLCAIYYIIWMYLLPKLGGYQLRPEILNVGNQGANTHRLLKVPLDEVDKWDREHDEAGRLRRRNEYGAEIASLEK